MPSGSNNCNRSGRVAGLALGLALLAAGCGSDDGAGVRDGSASASASGAASGSGTASGQAAACKPVGDAGKSDATVAVELKEWAVQPARADVPAGTVTFDASNTGKEPHELVVVRADDPAALPRAADGTVDEEKLPEGAFVGEVEAFPAGQHCTGTFELPAGRYALFCNLLETKADGSKENHYAKGMRARFEARG
jgi:plastocyanin